MMKQPRQPWIALLALPVLVVSLAACQRSGEDAGPSGSSGTTSGSSSGGSMQSGGSSSGGSMQSGGGKSSSRSEHQGKTGTESESEKSPSR